MPGGAAGLQNWQARPKKVERERGLSNKSPFLFLYFFVSHSFAFCRYRLIKAHSSKNLVTQWLHGNSLSWTTEERCGDNVFMDQECSWRLKASYARGVAAGMMILLVEAVRQCKELVLSFSFTFP